MDKQSGVKVSHILVATDFSDHAELALNWAQRLADAFDAKLTVLHVIDIYSLAQTSCRMVGSDFLGIVREEAQSGMGEVHAQAPAADVVILEGSPRPMIVETGLKLDCQMIVMGTHGRSGLSHLLLGSVAEYVVRHSKIPVLTVHAPDS